MIFVQLLFLLHLPKINFTSMKISIRLIVVSGVCAGLSILTNSIAKAQSFEDRKIQYFDSATANPNGNSMAIQAYLNQPVTQQYLDDIYAVMETRSTIDFAIVQLVRVMFLGDGVYDIPIMSNLNLVPYWVNYGDTLRGYWSENHMIMWMSSDWLIHERTDRPIDATLEQRLRHYLQGKIDYGFYEFMSSTYAPYCLSGLLNLADFSENVEIKELATQAAKRLLGEMLIATNDRGVFFPSAGRNYTEKYINPFGQNHSSLIYLLTGLGPAPSSASHSGGFLSTSTIDFSDVTATWTANLDTVLSIGHTLQEGFVINAPLSQVDRVMMQWSSGAYFHPEVVTSTAQLLVDSNMWEHVDFELLLPLSGIPVAQFPQVATNLSVVSTSSLNTGQDVSVFKNAGVVLTSVHDFHKGKVGFQQWPVVATVGTTAVYPASGPETPDWAIRNRNNANEHLPYVEQSHNVALVMYRPLPVPELLPFENKDVSLFWQDTAFDEIVENGNWLLGRNEENYVAVRRSCIGEIDGVRACETNVGQTWVIIVGNDVMYGSFSDFQNLIAQTQFEETWTADPITGDSTYFSSIAFDTIAVDYAWGPELGTAVPELEGQNSELLLYPNPATTLVTINIPETNGTQSSLAVHNALGQCVYQTNLGNTKGPHTIAMTEWSAGLYHIILDQGANRSHAKLMKE
jgi:hypothetical protein